MQRPSQHTYFLGIAKAVAKRATCIRRQYGAVIIRNDVIVSTGYCGTPVGMPHCETCHRQAKGIPSGKNYEQCRSIHAEQNAIIQAGMERTINGHIYIAGFDLENNGQEICAIPCFLCAKHIINAKIQAIVVADIGPRIEGLPVQSIIHEEFKLYKPENLYYYWLQKRGITRK